MSKTPHLSSLPWVSPFFDLGEAFYSKVNPSPLNQPYWVHINTPLVDALGLDQKAMETQETLSVFSGAHPIHGQASLAMVYAGHQFGGYSPQLGDGRGLLLGQLDTSEGIVDFHLKGAGKTPYSRFGDGRAVLRSSIREYLVGEAMHALGIPSSRALCITASNDTVMREEPEPTAMVTRLAKTHIRFGHFEFFHYNERFSELKALADYVIAQFLPDKVGENDCYEALLTYSVKQTAIMIAKWQSVGFAHGVMNTDNMSIIGETLDYGPYGFLDDYEPGFICNHSDYQGRYAFDQQPSIGLWNLNALAHALSSLISDKAIKKALAQYEPILVEHYAMLMREKFGLYEQRESDQTLCAELLHLMAKDKVDYTLLFRRLCDFDCEADNALLDALFTQKQQWQRWASTYRERLASESVDQSTRQERMRRHNPKFILRNYLLQNAIEKAQSQKDFSEIDQLMQLIRSPFDEHPDYESYASPPPAWGKHLPISCSS